MVVRIVDRGAIDGRRHGISADVRDFVRSLAGRDILEAALRKKRGCRRKNIEEKSRPLQVKDTKYIYIGPIGVVPVRRLDGV